MPEIRFRVQWPDGTQEECYSPSLVVKEYFTPNREYDLLDFVERSQSALQIASNRVLAKYGMPCSLALSQLKSIESTASRYQNTLDPKVRVIRFLE
jgi:uncharacterized repeat protein (TIGR04042 family)